MRKLLIRSNSQNSLELETPTIGPNTLLKMPLWTQVRTNAPRDVARLWSLHKMNKSKSIMMQSIKFFGLFMSSRSLSVKQWRMPWPERIVITQASYVQCYILYASHPLDGYGVHNQRICCTQAQKLHFVKSRCWSWNALHLQILSFPP